MANRFKKLLGGGSGGGVTGLTSASSGTALADNVIVRGDGTTGIQGSGAFVSDSGVITTGGVTASFAGIKDDGFGQLQVRGGDNAAYAPIITTSFEVNNSAASVRKISIRQDIIGISSDIPISFSDSTSASSTKDIGIERIAAGVLEVTDGSTGKGYLQTAGFKRKTADQTVTDSTTLVDDSHLSVSLAAGRSYGFKFTLFATELITSGLKIALAGTATHTNIIADVTYIPLGDLTSSNSTRLTAVGTGYDAASGFTSSRVIIEGTTTVNAAGTFLVQFAQNAETGAAESVTLLRGSKMEVWDIQ